MAEEMAVQRGKHGPAAIAALALMDTISKLCTSGTSP